MINSSIRKPCLSHEARLNSAAFSDRLTAKLCGRFVEVCISPENAYSGQGECEKNPAINKPKEPQDSITKRSAARSRKMVRQLCNCNNMIYMHTLTFAVSHIDYFQGEKPFILIPLESQKDREEVISLWKEFARKMRRRAERKKELFRYIAVIEKHEGKRAQDTTIKQGCYHVHFVSDTLYPKRLLQHVWRHGLCNHSDWSKGRKKRDLDAEDSLPAPDNPGAYLSKYIGKDGEDVESGKKRYWASRNLDKPVSLAGTEVGTVLAEGREIFRHDTEHKIEDGQIIRHTNITYLLPTLEPYKALACKIDRTAKGVRERKNRARLEVAKYKQTKELRDYENGRKEIYRSGIDRKIERDYNKREALESCKREAISGVKIFVPRIRRSDSENPCRIAIKIKRRRGVTEGPSRRNLRDLARKSVVFKSYNLPVRRNLQREV